jgi:hypothetical protein
LKFHFKPPEWQQLFDLKKINQQMEVKIRQKKSESVVQEALEWKEHRKWRKIRLEGERKKESLRKAGYKAGN